MSSSEAYWGGKTNRKEGSSWERGVLTSNPVRSSNAPLINACESV